MCCSPSILPVEMRVNVHLTLSTFLWWGFVKNTCSHILTASHEHGEITACCWLILFACLFSYDLRGIMNGKANNLLQKSGCGCNENYKNYVTVHRYVPYRIMGIHIQITMVLKGKIKKKSQTPAQDSRGLLFVVQMQTHDRSSHVSSVIIGRLC